MGARKSVLKQFKCKSLLPRHFSGGPRPKSRSDLVFVPVANKHFIHFNPNFHFLSPQDQKTRSATPRGPLPSEHFLSFYFGSSRLSEWQNAFAEGSHCSPEAQPSLETCGPQRELRPIAHFLSPQGQFCRSATARAPPPF